MNRLASTMPEDGAEIGKLAIAAEAARRMRAESEAAELMHIIRQLEYRLAFVRRYLPNTAATMLGLCYQARSYTCGADFLARLNRAEAIIHSHKILGGN